MKKSSILSAIAFAFIMLLSTDVTAQKFASLDKSPLDISVYRTDRSTPAIAKVVYSRPQLKGRDLSSLAPNGKMWRTGANEATEITFYKDVTFGGKAVKAGTYSLFTIPGNKECTVILNSATGGWGAYGYDKGNDVARVKGSVSSGDAIEAFGIAFVDGKMHMAWGTTRVAVSIK
jgi:hypothetical protein